MSLPAGRNGLAFPPPPAPTTRYRSEGGRSLRRGAHYRAVRAGGGQPPAPTALGLDVRPVGQGRSRTARPSPGSRRPQPQHRGASRTHTRGLGFGPACAAPWLSHLKRVPEPSWDSREDAGLRLPGSQLHKPVGVGPWKDLR